MYQKKRPFLKKTKGVVNVTILKDLALLVKATGGEKEKIKLKNQKNGGSILVAQVDQF
jgi:hypothetical protein